MSARPEEESASSAAPLQVMFAALWFALFTGVAEVCLLALKKFYMGQMIRGNENIVWLSPLASTMFLAGPAALAALIAWKRPSRAVLDVGLWIFAFYMFFCLSLLYTPIETYGKAILAAGLSVQAVRLIRPRRLLFARFVRATLPALVGVVAVGALAVSAWRWNGYREAEQMLPPSPQTPNVLLVVMDTVRSQSLSLYGYARPTTPNLERLAQSAVVFNRAMAPSSWTFPSHATMFTGRWPHELSANWRAPLDARYPTLAEVLRDRGFRTAGFVANTFYGAAEFGLGRGFMHYEDYPVSASQLLVSSAVGREFFSFSLNRDLAFKVRQAVGYQDIPGRRHADTINDEFLGWLAQQDRSRPFFAFLNYLDTHQPFLPSEPFQSQFRTTSSPRDARHWWGREWSPEAIRAEVDAYDAEVAYVDHEVGRLISGLQSRGQLDNTIVIITSDHGEHLGEHGFMRHGNTLYMEVLQVPLLIMLPKRGDQPLRVDRAVSLRDLPATVLNLLGIDCGQCLPGTPLTPYWDAANGTVSAPPSEVVAELSQGIRLPDRYPNASGDLQSILVGNFHYIVSHAGEELYDLSVDPVEARNLAQAESSAATRNDMKRRLDGVLKGAAPPHHAATVARARQTLVRSGVNFEFDPSSRSRVDVLKHEHIARSRWH